MSKTGIAHRTDLPHMFANCAPVAEADGSTPDTFTVATAAVDANKVNLADLRRWQTGLELRQFIAEGIVAASGHSWFPHNAVGAVNFVYVSSAELISVGGTDNDELVMEFSDDPLNTVLYTKTTQNELNPTVTITGYLYHTTPQPGDMLRFGGGSKLASICEPVIIQVLGNGTASGLSANQYKVKVHMDCSSALDLMDGETGPVIVSHYQYGANQRIYQFVLAPKWFTGQRVLRTVTLAEIPTDGVIQIESINVMHPGGFDPLFPVFVFEGRLDGAWESVSQATDRVFIEPDKSWVAFKTTKPSDGNGDLTLTDDLTATYDMFRLVYYKYKAGAIMACTIVGNACKWARRDCTNSVGNLYGLSAGDAQNGIGVDADGNHHYCAKVWTDVNDALSDTNSDGYDDTVTPEQVAATGAARFPAHGFCNQKGTCDQFTAAENDTGREAPFRYEYHLARYFKELWGACDAKKDQIAVGVETYLAGRVMAAGIAWLSGYVGLANPNGYRDKVEFSANGNWGYPATYIDGDDTHLISLAGVFQEYNSNDPDAAGAGNITANVTGFTATRDPIDITNTAYVSDELERIGFAVERDTGAMAGYSPAASSVAIESQTITLAAFNALLTTLQTKPLGTFQRGESGADWVLKLLPLRQESKAHIFLDTRTVVSVASLGSDVYRITMANGVHSYSTINTGDHGDPSDSFDDIVTWHGGGTWPIAPEQYQEITNFYEDPKTTGSRLRGAWRGDSIAIGEKHYVITDVHPHGGAEAADWDGATPLDSYCVGQNYTTFGKKQDTVDVYDPSGAVGDLVADDTIDFYKLAMVALPGYTREYSTDGGSTWAEIPAESVTYDNNGEVHGTDEWLVSLTSVVYFRFVDVRLMDHRGIITAPMYNKTQAAVDSLVWCDAPAAGGYDVVTFAKGCQQSWFFSGEPYPTCGVNLESDPPFTFSSSGSNIINIVEGGLGDETCTQSAIVRFSSEPIGAPLQLRRIPSSWIVEAKAQITSSDVTKHVQTDIPELLDCSGTVIREASTVNDFSVVDIDYVLIGITADGDFQTLVPIPTPPPNVTTVVDFTEAIIAMADNMRNYDSFSMLPSPAGFDLTGSGVESLLPKADPSYEIIESCDPGFCEFGNFNLQVQTTITWGGITIDKIKIRIDFPQWFKDLQLVQPRWPSFKALP